MVLDLDPAALGGLAGLIALSGWALGRIQGALRAAFGNPEAAPHSADPAVPSAREKLGLSQATPMPVCRQRVRDERRALLAEPVALTELHEEAEAIRRDARILEQDSAHASLLALPRSSGEDDCRYLGRSGQPTCPAPQACSSCGAVQLSVEPVSLTRV